VLTDTMAFMFETRAVIRPTRYALDSPLLQRDYARVWQELRRQFAPPEPAAAATAGAAKPAARTRLRPRARKRSRR
jgi:hypothetical protein